MLTFAQQALPSHYGPAATVLFFVMAALVVVSAWAVVVSQNIVRMSVYLLLTLGGAAGMYFMLEAEFLAAVQLIVYAGGTLILIVFGIMLTSKNPFLQLQVQLWERIVGLLVGVLLTGILLFAAVSSPMPAGSAGSSAMDVAAESSGHVARIGRALLSTYLVPFEVAAVLLLVVMIGAAYMARRRAR